MADIRAPVHVLDPMADYSRLNEAMFRREVQRVLSDLSNTSQLATVFGDKHAFKIPGPAGNLDFPLIAKLYDRGARDYHVAAFGAVGDGATDDTAAVQSAITAAISSKKAGRVIFEPQKTYRMTGELNLDQSGGITLEGGSGRYGVGVTPATASLLFTQTGSGNCISARSSYGLTMRGLRIAHDSASFTGVLLNLDYLAYDTAYALIEGCEFKGSATARTALGISMHNAILMTIRDSLFVDMVGGVRGKSGAGYCNGVQVERCTFHRCTDYGIKNAAEAWLVHGCNFETAADGGALGYTEDMPSFGPLTFKGCWFGDATVAARPWIRFLGQVLNVEGCMMAATGGAGTYAGILAGSTSSIYAINLFGNIFGMVKTLETTGTAAIDKVVDVGNMLLSGTMITDAGNQILNLAQLPPRAARADVFRNTAQSVPNATFTDVIWNQEAADPHAWHDNATNPERVTVDATGIYDVHLSVHWASNASGNRQLLLRVNGSTVRKSVVNPTTGGFPTGQELSAHLSLATGDYLTAMAYQDSGGALDIDAANQPVRLTVMKVR